MSTFLAQPSCNVYIQINVADIFTRNLRVFETASLEYAKIVNLIRSYPATLFKGGEHCRLLDFSKADDYNDVIMDDGRRLYRRNAEIRYKKLAQSLSEIHDTKLGLQDRSSSRSWA